TEPLARNRSNKPARLDSPPPACHCRVRPVGRVEGKREGLSRLLYIAKRVRKQSVPQEFTCLPPDSCRGSRRLKTSQHQYSYTEFSNGVCFEFKQGKFNPKLNFVAASTK
ncbi:hypothetical protein CHARACLAT_001658, partial [Characodon lateralis]|nr:hypothetical protein [Characodon lateralis]